MNTKIPLESYLDLSTNAIQAGLHRATIRENRDPSCYNILINIKNKSSFRIFS